MYRKVLFGMFFLMSTACGTLKTSSAVFVDSTVAEDYYQSTVLIESPVFYQAQGYGVHLISLRAKINIEADIAYQLHIQDSQAVGWRFFDRAYDINGEKFEFVDIDHDVTLGVTSEIFAINLTRKYLDKAVTESINIKVFGEDAEKVILVPSHYVEGFLQKVDEYLINK